VWDGDACIHDGDVLPLRPLLETTVEARPLCDTRTRSPLVPVALQLRVVVQVFFPAAIWQGFGEALIEPVWAESCGAASNGPRTQSIQAGSLLITTHHRSAGQVKGVRAVANSHVMLDEALLT